MDVKLLKLRAIMGSASINPHKLGYTNVFFLGITLAPGKDVRKIAEKLASMKEFFFVALSLGPTPVDAP